MKQVLIPILVLYSMGTVFCIGISGNQNLLYGFCWPLILLWKLIKRFQRDAAEIVNSYYPARVEVKQVNEYEAGRWLNTIGD